MATVNEKALEAATKQIIGAMQLHDFGRQIGDEFICSAAQIELLEKQAGIAAANAIPAYISALPGEHGELVERLRAASNKSWEAEIKATEAAYAGKSGEWDIKGLLLVIRALLGDSTEAAAALTAQAETIADLRAKNEAREVEIERLREAMEAATVAGWNACRKSIYAVCEDVTAEADRLQITSKPGTASEEQHAEGYYNGQRYAAKSIARGFNSMEARDDDNLTEAIRRLAEGGDRD